MSNLPITLEQIESKFSSHRAKIQAREERIRREESELERERAALVLEGTQYFEGRLQALRERAIARAEQAAKALAALPPKPVEPNPEDVSSVGFEEYVRLAAEYPATRKAHDEAAIAAARPLGVALRGLVHEASTVRRQARELGFECYRGVGFLREDERGVDAVRGTALTAFAHSCDNPVEGCARAAECGELTASHCNALAALLRSEPARVPAPEKPETVWQRITSLGREREHAAEFERRGGAPLTQTQRDVAKYVDGLGANGGRPMIGGVNLDLDRKAREATAEALERRRREAEAAEQRELDLERNGFSRTGGAE